MRQEYIDQIKAFVLLPENRKRTFGEIKADTLTFGATEEEFTEALKSLYDNAKNVQMQQTPLDEKSHFKKYGEYKTPPEEKKRSALRHLVEIDIATHIILVAVAFVFLGGVILAPGEIKNILANDEEKPATTVARQVIENTLTAQVYAHTEAIDTSQIFSLKPENITLSISGTPKKEVYGYFPYWMLENEDKVTLNALTTVSLFGLEVDGRGDIVTEGPDGEIDPGWAMWINPKLQTFIQRVKRRGLKTELTIKAFNNNNIEKLVQSDDAQKVFISNTIYLMQSKGINGINLDFEYVGTPSEKVRDGFTRLVTNLRAEMKRIEPRSTLTISSYITAAAVPRLVDVQPVSDQIDAYVIMGYDFHTPSGNAGPVSPMEGSYSILGFMQSYLEKVSPDKLILAVPYYGYDWPIPAVGDRERSRTRPYAEIVASSKSSDILWDDTAQTPYYQYKDTETGEQRVVHFENTRSLSIKYDFVNRKNLRGIGIWALGYDGLNADLRSLIIEKFAN
jgi:spore germination protein YaaH